MIEIILYCLLFIVSTLILYFSAKFLLNSLSEIAKFLKWKEFVVAFITIALGASLPNLVVGIISAINKIPELSLGDVLGGNIIDLTLIVGIASLISLTGISAPSKTIQNSAFFTLFIALLPVILISDNKLSRLDGVFLILSFWFYIFWLFSEKKRFLKVYDSAPSSLSFFFKNILIFIFSLVFLILSATGVVNSSIFFSHKFNISFAAIGIFVVALGNCLPEAVFSFEAAKRGQNWLILGNLMGSVIITSTLVLGIVSLISPIHLENFSFAISARIFLFLSALFFVLFLKTSAKITKKEGIFLIAIYIAFLISQILVEK